MQRFMKNRLKDLEYFCSFLSSLCPLTIRDELMESMKGHAELKFYYCIRVAIISQGGAPKQRVFILSQNNSASGGKVGAQNTN